MLRRRDGYRSMIVRTILQMQEQFDLEELSVKKSLLSASWVNLKAVVYASLSHDPICSVSRIAIC